MPKVYLTRQDKLNRKLIALIYMAMKAKGLTQSDVADRLGIKQPSFAKKLKKCQFTYADLTIIFEALDMQDEEILSVMRLCEGRK